VSLDQLDLTDDQHTAILRAAAALQRVDHGPFLRAVAQRLQGETIGDGSVGRAIREVLALGCYRNEVSTPAIGGGVKGAVSRAARSA
jgi:hypothetical protein